MDTFINLQEKFTFCFETCWMFALLGFVFYLPHLFIRQTLESSHFSVVQNKILNTFLLQVLGL